MLKSPVDSKTDTFCPIAYFFLFVLSKVLTGFYLPMGATLIQASLEAGFVPVAALDVGAMGYSYVYFYWHGNCNTRAAFDFTVMFTFIGTIFARHILYGYVNNYWHGYCIGKSITVMSRYIGMDLA